VAADSPLGPFDVVAAHPLTSAAFYAGRIARDRHGQPVLIAFHNEDDSGFVGSATDPIPVVWSSETTLATVGLKTPSHPTKPARLRYAPCNWGERPTARASEWVYRPTRPPVPAS
jgi:hypothetical protein